MAHIEKRGNKYRIRISDGFDPLTGKRRFKNMTWTPEAGMTERQIEKELERQAVLFEEKNSRNMIPDDRTTLSEFVEIWLRDYAEPNLKKTTLAQYKALLVRILEGLGHLRMSKISPAHINVFYANLRENGIRVDGKYICITDFRKFLKDNNISRQKLSDYSRVSMSTIEAIVNGTRVSKATAGKLCDTMNISIDLLFEPEHIDKPLAPKTLSHYHKLLKSIFAKAVKWNVIYDNPCERVDPPKLQRKEAEYLSETETRQLLDALDDAPMQYRVMVYMMVYLGARRGEICGLEWNDIDWENNRIHIQRNLLYLPEVGTYEDTPKTENSNRIVVIPNRITDMLRELQECQNHQRAQLLDHWVESGKIFTQFNGSPIHPSTITKWLNKFCKAKGLPHIYPHMLRHTSATMLLMQGLPLKAVSKRLGHAQASTTSDIYGHSLLSVDEIAAEALDNMLDPASKLKGTNDTN